jgi:hypothetical protein
MSCLSAAACSPKAKGRRGGLADVVGSSLVSSLALGLLIHIGRCHSAVGAGDGVATYIQ